MNRSGNKYIHVYRKKEGKGKRDHKKCKQITQINTIKISVWHWLEKNILEIVYKRGIEEKWCKIGRRRRTVKENVFNFTYISSLYLPSYFLFLSRSLYFTPLHVFLYHSSPSSILSVPTPCYLHTWDALMIAVDVSFSRYPTVKN